MMGLMERASCLNSSLRVIKLDYTYRLIPNISEEKVKARKQMCNISGDVIKMMRDELVHEAFKIYARGLTNDERTAIFGDSVEAPEIRASTEKQEK